MAGGSSGTSSDSLKGAHGALSLPSAGPGRPGRARPAAARAHGAAAACCIAEATALAVPGGKPSTTSPPEGALCRRPGCARFTGCRPAACTGCVVSSLLRVPLRSAAAARPADTARRAASSAARSAAGVAARSGRKGSQRPPRCAATEPGAWPHASSLLLHASARPLLPAQVRTGGSDCVFLLQATRAAPRHQRCSQRQRLVCAACTPAPAASGVQAGCAAARCGVHGPAALPCARRLRAEAWPLGSPPAESPAQAGADCWWCVACLTATLKGCSGVQSARMTQRTGTHSCTR